MVRPRTDTETGKREILQSFCEVLSEEGLEEASIAKTADRNGTHPSLIIHYFSNKEEMIIALVYCILKMLKDTFLPGLEATQGPGERKASS